jgi:hypothetical protein
MRRDQYLQNGCLGGHPHQYVTVNGTSPIKAGQALPSFSCTLRTQLDLFEGRACA